MASLIERVELYYRAPRENADKVYKIELTREDDGGYRVTGYNGRRGARLTPQPKTEHPVFYNMARRLFDELERSKLNHRRTPYTIRDRHVAGRENAYAAGIQQPGSLSQTEIRPCPDAASTIAAAARNTISPDTETSHAQTDTHSENGAYTAAHLEALEL